MTSNSNMTSSPITLRGISIYTHRLWALVWLINLGVLGLILAACTQDQAGEVDSFIHPPTKGPTPTLIAALQFDLGPQLGNNSRLAAPLVLDAPDGCARLEFEQGTALFLSDGHTAGRLVIQPDYPKKLPQEAYGVPISAAYRFGPDEIRLDTPVRIIFTCLKNFKRTMVNDISLGMVADDGQWEQHSIEGNAEQVWTRLESLRPGWRYLLVGPAPMGS